MRFKKLFAVVLGSLIVPALSLPSMAQNELQVSDFANANVKGAPSATVQIVNPGTTFGNLCAMIYVFKADATMTECCGCLMEHNALITLDVNDDLTSNPAPDGGIFGIPARTGVIKIVSAEQTIGCDPTSISAFPELRAWATHIENSVNGVYPITRTAFSNADLGDAEFAFLQSACKQIFNRGLFKPQGSCSCGH